MSFHRQTLFGDEKKEAQMDPTFQDLDKDERREFIQKLVSLQRDINASKQGAVDKLKDIIFHQLDNQEGNNSEDKLRALKEGISKVTPRGDFQLYKTLQVQIATIGSQYDRQHEASKKPSGGGR
jgi:hypothetical protein